MQIDAKRDAAYRGKARGIGMVDEVTKLKTDGDLLRRLQDAKEPSRDEVREQRVSFAYGNLGSKSSMTREQVRRLVECD